ncbi:hypothetical protein B2J88_27335 [Rhodococcus sp. SRB_17]|nr:hypothetical protein [Rhodococcus sp. SRB_17]
MAIIVAAAGVVASTIVALTGVVAAAIVVAGKGDNFTEGNNVITADGLVYTGLSRNHGWIHGNSKEPHPRQTQPSYKRHG